MTEHVSQPALADADAFLALLRGLSAGPDELVRDFFAHGEPLALARAPGRLDVMGGIADYSGSLVLELPLREATLAAAQRAPDGAWRFASLPESEGAGARVAELARADVARLLDGGYAAARSHFRADPAGAWAAYLAGVVLVLAREKQLDASAGLRVLVRSDVPEGKGVSSSAALEVAAMAAVAALGGLRIDGGEAARLCQMAENLVVGAPCGIMDQMTAALGKADHLLALLCQPAEVRGFVRLPESVAVWGIDSGIRHAVSGSDYTSVRTGAFMGYRMLAELAGLGVTGPDETGVVAIDDPAWRGYLANVGPEVFTSRFEAHLPQEMTGAEFLARYGGTTDRVTHVEPGMTYAIRQPTAHPVHEHARVTRFAELLAEPPSEAVLCEMGELMYDSHASYSACGIGSTGTDRLVELVREAGPAAGLYGAKITGGGSGGTVAVLGRADAAGAVAAVAERYRQETGRGGYVFRGSSPGAFPLSEDCPAWQAYARLMLE